MSQLRELSGKHAVVTGASRGIGKEIALAYARAGADLTILARNLNELATVAEEIRGQDVSCTVVKVDLAEPDNTKRACTEIVNSAGHIDILVNNAGADLSYGVSVADSEPDLWWRTIEINIRGVYLMVHYLLPHLKDGGKIINMSSGMGLTPAPNQSSYVVSKAGLHIFTEVLANELWPRKIDVNNLIPGPVATEMFNWPGREEALQEDGVMEKFKDELPPFFPPQERMKSPREVAELALYMATRPVGGATGQTFSLGRRPF